MKRFNSPKDAALHRNQLQRFAVGTQAKRYDPALIQAAAATIDWISGSVADPDEMLRRAGIKRKDLEKLTADDEIQQCLETRLDALTGTPYRLEPSQNRAAKLVQEELDKSIIDAIKCAFKAVPLGYSVFQANYVKRENGKIGIRSFWRCPMDWFKITPNLEIVSNQDVYFIDDDGNKKGLAMARGSFAKRLYPDKYFVVIRDGSYINPYGEALLSRLYFPVLWRSQGWRFWLEYLAAFGQPIIVGKTPDFVKFVEAMKAQGVRSAIAYQGSDQDKIEQIKTSGTGEFKLLEDTLTQRIERLILGQSLTSQVGSTGSYAAAKVADNVRADKKQADINLIRPVMQEIVDWLCYHNNLKPLKIIIGDEQGLETERADRDSKLFPVMEKSGIKPTLDYFLDAYGFDESHLIEDEINNDNKDNINPGDNANNSGNDNGNKDDNKDNKDDKKKDVKQSIDRLITFASGKGNKFTSPQEAIENITQLALDKAKEKRLQDAIRSAVMAATDKDDLIEKLAVILGNVPEDQFSRILTLAQFTADIVGFVSANEGLS